jgi:NitT/TauT family transport system permease protein
MNATSSGGSNAGWFSALKLIALLLVLWQALAWMVGDVAMRTPLQTMTFTANLLASPSFWPHLAETGRAFGLALLLAVLIGLAIGFLLGINRFASDVLEPVLVALYSIPKITLYPILLLMFGLGVAAKVAFGTIHGVIPIALFTLAAVRNVRPVFVKTGRVMGLGTGRMISGILLPAAMPEIFTGLRVGFSLTLIGTLLGEMFASQRGLGFMLMNAIGLHNVDVIMALTFLLVLFAGSASGLLLFLNRRLYQRA